MLSVEVLEKIEANRRAAIARRAIGRAAAGSQALDHVLAAAETCRPSCSKLEGMDAQQEREWSDRLVTAASALGIASFYSWQANTLKAWASGRDSLVLSGTGSGKSVCFQAPGLLCPRGHIVVIVSPLISLMRDQVKDPIWQISMLMTHAVHLLLCRCCFHHHYSTCRSGNSSPAD